MTKKLQTQYKLEYEHTDISLDDLCSKYSIKLSELKGYQEWEKVIEEPEVLVTSLDTSPSQPNPIDSSSPPIIINSNKTLKPATIDDSEDIEQDIKTFKAKAIAHCLLFMEKDVRFAEVKEFKDIVSIVDSIDKSQKGQTGNGPTINVLVQNITERFKDDC